MTMSSMLIVQELLSIGKASNCCVGTSSEEVKKATPLFIFIQCQCNTKTTEMFMFSCMISHIETCVSYLVFMHDTAW